MAEPLDVEIVRLEPPCDEPVGFLVGYIESGDQLGRHPHTGGRATFRRDIGKSDTPFIERYVTF